MSLTPIVNADTVDTCRLLSGTFALLIQGLLASVCLLTLALKRHSERPQRDLVTWGFDVTKQGCGSSLGHFGNICLSIYVSRTVGGGAESQSECAWYLASYLTDCSLGLAMNIGLLQIAETILRIHAPSVRLGDYGHPPRISSFYPQLLLWLVIIIVSKVVILTLLIQASQPLDSVLDDLFDRFFRPTGPRVELFLVMILIPGFLNIFQFWVTDGCIKAGDDGEGGGSRLYQNLVDKAEDSQDDIGGDETGGLELLQR